MESYWRAIESYWRAIFVAIYEEIDDFINFLVSGELGGSTGGVEVRSVTYHFLGYSKEQHRLQHRIVAITP